MLVNAAEVFATCGAEATGAQWSIAGETRHLDVNLVRLPADGVIEMHEGPDVDVLWLVVDGSGTLFADHGPRTVRGGDLIWLPRARRRGISAGSRGVGYVTVHQRRQSLQLAAPPRARE